MENLTGKQFGPYRIVAPLGEGGMASVYKAYQANMDRNVALKVLPRYFASDPNFVHRFEREAKVIAQLEHPHILPVHDFGESDGYTYLVMRFVKGGDLAKVMTSGPLSMERILKYMTEIGAALDYAHKKGVIHRDIKPSNVLIDEQDNCLLSDFGLAKMIISDSRFTASGAFIGTPTYASPEQCMGGELDARSDIYSLGVMLYEMCTGRPPFEADTPMGVVLKHINDPLPPPHTVNPEISEALERVILKALAKAPADRYGTAGEMVSALRAVAGGKDKTGPESMSARKTELESAGAKETRLGAAAKETKLESIGIQKTELEPQATAAKPSAPRRLAPLALVLGCLGGGLVLLLVAVTVGVLWIKSLPGKVSRLEPTSTLRSQAAVLSTATAGKTSMPTSAPSITITPNPVQTSAILATSTTESLPTSAVSVSVHVVPGTILEKPSSFVAFSPDGKWLVIAQHEITYYDAQSLQDVRTYKTDSWVGGLAISPDSKVLAVIDMPGVMLFDLASGSQLLTLDRTTISTSAVSSSFLAFTPDSRSLAVVLGDVVKLFDVASGQETSTIVAKGSNAILFSPDGQSLYAASWEGITVWDVASGTQTRTIGNYSNSANRLALSPDGSLLASGGYSGEQLVLWEAATGRQLRTFTGHTGGILDLAFSPDGKILFSTADDVTIKLWEVATGKLLQTLVGHTEPAASLRVSPDGTTFVSGSQDGTTRLWTLSSGTPGPTATLGSSITIIRPTPLPLSGHAIGVENAAQVKNQNKLDIEGEFVAWSPDGKWLVVGGRQIHYYDAQSLQEVRSFQADRWVNGLVISPDSKLLAAIDESRGVMLFDLESGSELLTLARTDISTSAASSSFLAFTPDSRSLAVVLGDVVKLFDVASGQETGTIIAKGSYAIVFSPDGQSLYAGGWEGITVWDVATGAQIRKIGSYSNSANRLALSPDGSLLLSSGSSDQPMVLWEADSGHQLRTFSGHTGGISDLAFSPDGKILFSSGSDLTVKLWEVATGKLLQTLVGPTEAATSLGISPDGATLASIGYDQGVWLWSVPVP